MTKVEGANVTEKKKKLSLLEKLTTDDWMSPRQLKAMGMIYVVLYTFIAYAMFLAVREIATISFNATTTFAVASGVICALAIFIISTSITTYRIRKKLRLKTGQQEKGTPH